MTSTRLVRSEMIFSGCCAANSPSAWHALTATPTFYSWALSKAETGQRAWVDAFDRDSCHMVWIQFHEDLLATLGIPRGSDN
jgi:hypothetical protein